MKRKGNGKKLRVAVLVGGPSVEYDVSLKSGENVLSALDPESYDCTRVHIGRDGVWEFEPEQLPSRADIAFIALHGTYGEDGTVQALLDSFKMPYTGSNSTSSALAINKFLSLRLLHDHGIAVPDSCLVPNNAWREAPANTFRHIREHFGYPIVVKPNDNGSSVGVSIITKEKELIQAMDTVFSVSRHALIQNYIRGRELTCSVLDHGWSESAFALLPTAIVPKKHNFFDFRSKYDKDGADEITPPPYLSDAQRQLVQRTAVRAHQLLGCRGFSRSDFLWTPKGGLVCLEINTIPGLTEQSLFPKAANASGLPFSKALDIVVKAALYRA